MTGAALLVFGAAAAAARRDTVAEVERDVFAHVNSLPDRANLPLQAVMQFGSFGAIWVTAGLIAAAGRKPQAATVAATGTAVWALCKVAKRMIGRERPAGLHMDATIRGRPQSGLGFPSGHAAVASTLAALAAPGHGAATSAALWGAAMTVAVSRVYVGAHLPLDVVGGASIGIASAAAAAGCRG